MSDSYDLNALLREPASTKLNSAALLQITSESPFVSIPGTFNARDLGSPLPATLRWSDNVKSKSTFLRRGHVYRTGSLESLSQEGESTIADLGIKTIFDLRSSKERKTNPDPIIPNVRNVWRDSMSANKEKDASQGQSSDRKERDEAEDVPTAFFADMYIQMLETHQPGIRSVFEHILSHADQPLLMHCTAGKDRTGLVAALILAAADAPIEYINLEYALSRIGIDEVRPMLIRKMTGKDMPVSELTGRQRLYAEVKLDAMTPVMKHIHDKYDGVDGYLQKELGFSREEVGIIRKNLVKN